MNKEDILARSRQENKNRDLQEQEVQTKAGAIAAIVGALVCCILMVVSPLILGDVLLSPWVIYFSMIGTQSIVRYIRLKRRSDLAVAILFFIALVCDFVALVLKMLEYAA